MKMTKHKVDAMVVC